MLPTSTKHFLTEAHVLTIQPLTAFLRDQKVKGILNSKKLRILFYPYSVLLNITNGYLKHYITGNDIIKSTPILSSLY